MNKILFLLILNLSAYSNSFGQKIVINDSFCCSFPIYSVAVNPNTKLGNEIASTFGCKVKLWDISHKTFLESYNLEGHMDDITSLDFSPDGFSIASGSKDKSVKIWNLILRKEKFTLIGHTGWVKNVLYSHNGKILVTCGKDGMVLLWNPETGMMINKIYQSSISINTIAINETDEFIAFGLNDGRIIVWDLIGSKVISEYNIHKDPINSLIFKPGSRHIISGGNDKTIRIYNFENNTQIASLTGHTQSITAFSVIQTTTSYSLISASADETIRFWDLDKLTLKSVINQDGKVFSLCVGQNKEHPYSKLIISGSEDKNIKFWKPDVNNEIARIVSLQNGNSIIITPENYFYTSGKAYPNAFFTGNGDEKIPEGYLEIKYNRPDLVCNSLGISPEKSYAFQQAYRKRITRSGLDSSIFVNHNFPTIKFVSDSSITSNNKTIKINLQAEDLIYNLTKIVININGVTEKIQLDTAQSKIMVLEKSIILSNGKNLISAYTSNSNGIESKTVTYEIYYTGEKAPENLYVISLGVSIFKDKTYNLLYPNKDATDIRNELKKQNGFNKITSYLLTDSLVTTKNIMLLKEKLMSSTVDDEVVIFYSGVGLLSQDFDYYLGTYDMDFNKPEAAGLAYEELKNIFKDIPARKRIMLIDASNSMDFDRSEFSSLSLADTLSLTRGGIQTKINSKLQPFKLMKDYYPEEKNKDGIIQVNGSMGGEYSLESSVIKSGIFAHSIINSINDKKSDLDNDNAISVKELLSSISAGVIKFSNGAQHPTMSQIGNNDMVLFRVAENNDNKSPLITILEPETVTRGGKLIQINKSSIKIKGIVNDESEITYLSINEEQYPVNENKFFEAELTLKEGENNISIEAVDLYGNKVIQKFTIISSENDKKQFGTYHALIIGVSEYKDDNLNLQFPILDSKKLRHLLVTKYTFDSVNVTFLENPTRQEIFEAFTILENSLTEDDNLLIFYAGHGAMRPKSDQGYWLPSDANKQNTANWVTNDDIKTLMKSIQARHILLITDACFSGKMFYTTRDAFDSISPAISENNKMKSRRAITSGALESVPDKSVFIEYLCDCLQTNKERWLSSKKLYVIIKDDVTNRSQSHQKPLDGKIADTGDENGDFIFIKR